MDRRGRGRRRRRLPKDAPSSSERSKTRWRQQMHHPRPAFLHPALHRHQPRRHGLLAIALEQAGVKRDIDHAGLVLQRDEHHLAIARPLAHQHQPRRLFPRAIAASGEIAGAQKIFAGEKRPQKLHRDAPSSDRRKRLVIGDDLFAEPQSAASRRPARRPTPPPRRRRKAARGCRPTSAAPPKAPSGGRAIFRSRAQ